MLYYIKTLKRYIALWMKSRREKPTRRRRDERSSNESAKRRNKKKIKATIYLTEEAEQAFTELYIHRLRKDRKTDKSLSHAMLFRHFLKKNALNHE